MTGAGLSDRDLLRFLREQTAECLKTGTRLEMRRNDRLLTLLGRTATRTEQALGIKGLRSEARLWGATA